MNFVNSSKILQGLIPENYMTKYYYSCPHCGANFKTGLEIKEDSLTKCEKCDNIIGKNKESLLIMFKGGGFHSNDYK